MKSRRIARVLFISVIFALLFSCAGTVLGPSAEDEFNAGLSLFNRGMFEEAAGRFERSTEIDPEYGMAYLYLSRCYLSIGRYKEAMPQLRAAFRLVPEEAKKEIPDLVIDIIVNSPKDLDAESRREFEEIIR